MELIVPTFFCQSPFESRFFSSLERPVTRFHSVDRFSRWSHQPISSIFKETELAVSQIENEKDKFQVAVDLKEFQPNEISVRVADGVLIVEGKQEEKTDEKGNNQQIVRGYCHLQHRYTLPKNVDLDTVASSVSAEGTLKITASKKQPDIASDQPAPLVDRCRSRWLLQPISSHFKETDLAVSQIANETDKFHVAVDLKGFQPNEITVRVADGVLIVEGKQEEKADEKEGNHQVVRGYRHVQHRYTLPKNVDLDSVASSLSTEGTLKITASKKQKEQPKERHVPIEVQK